MKTVLFFIFTIALFSFAAQAQEKLGGFDKSGQSNLISTTVVINEIYGGAASATGTYTRDYVELKNISPGLVNISGWSVQYASSAGTFSNVTAIPANTVLRPGDTYLVAGALAAGVNALPGFNVAGTFAASNTAGKFALVSNTTPLTGSGCPITAPIVDFVGYGGAANCQETTNAPAPANQQSSLNRNALGSDTDVNMTDFTNAAPTPQVSLQPTAAGANLAGRIVTSDGRGISKVWVMLIDNAGNTQTVLTSSFGYYLFEGLRTAETYTVSVQSKQYQFNPSARVVTLEDNLNDFDFTAEP